MSHPLLSIVIPAYNEAKAIQAGCLTNIIDYILRAPWWVDAIVVDDGSQDGTAELAACYLGELGRVKTIPHGGKAAALATGILEARGDIVLTTDMDQATPIYEVDKLLAYFEAGWDIVVGSRGNARPGAPLARRILSLGQVIMRNLLLGLDLTDTQCGFKCYDRRAAVDVLHRLVVYAPDRLPYITGPSVTSGFDVEFLFVAERLGYTIAEAPVIWRHRNSSRVHPVRDAVAGLADLLKISAENFAGHYPKSKISLENRILSQKKEAQNSGHPIS